MTESKQSITVLALSALAFTVCFAAWTMNGVLVTFLVGEGVFNWDKAQVGMLIGIPILTGSLMRLPLGVLTDKFGGRLVFTILMVLSAVPMYLMSYATDYTQFLLASLGFGLTGASFAVGVAYVSLWFRKERQGTALGIFGIGNSGSAMTSIFAPQLLRMLTQSGQGIDGWRTLPQLYAGSLAVMAVAFYFLTKTRRIETSPSLSQRMEPLRHTRVWRFGLYYFVVFGGFVALSQWLIPYYVSAYSMSIAAAGLMASLFSFPSGITRAVGGWLSDKYGSRRVMYWVFSACLVCFIFLCIPRMDIQSPGQGVLADNSGFVTAVNDREIAVGERRYALLPPVQSLQGAGEGILVWPTFSFGQEPLVKPGEKVEKRQLLARGTTHIYFQANAWIFTGLVFIMAVAMGIGMGAVYKFIPEYYPTQVGVVGGIVGVLGGLGGFFFPIIFGLLLNASGIWTTSWMFLFLVASIAFAWLHRTVQKIMAEKAADLMRTLESGSLEQQQDRN